MNEQRLRRSLRLDPDERGPRIDIAALVVARNDDRRLGIAALALAGAAAVAASIAAMAPGWLFDLGLPLVIAGAELAADVMGQVDLLLPAFLATVAGGLLYVRLTQHWEVTYARAPRA